jgi:hypothetical protein
MFGFEHWNLDPAIASSLKAFGIGAPEPWRGEHLSVRDTSAARYDSAGQIYFRFAICDCRFK